MTTSKTTAEVINLTDSDHAEEVCSYINMHCVVICPHLQKGGTDNPQFENCTSEVSVDVQSQYTNDEALGVQKRYEFYYKINVHYLC